MKKILLSAALFAACASLSAQKLTYVPFADNGYLTGTTISSDGRYVAGGDLGGQAFIYDTQTGQIKYFASPNAGDEDSESTGGEVRSIGCDGIGVGYMDGHACEFNFATGEYKQTEDDMSLLNYRSEDGTISAGFAYSDSYEWFPYYTKDGERHELPRPTEEWLGFEQNGLSVTGGTADASIFCGSVQDNFASYPLCIWVRNLDGESYSVIPISKRFYDASMGLDGPQEYDWFEGASISDNGKWICLNIHKKDADDRGLSIARYDVVNDNMEILDCPNASSTSWYYASDIADDGTIIGFIEDQVTYGRTGVICLSGETEVKLLSEVYPNVAELSQLDVNQLNVPCSITPDGRYIEGFGYVDYSDTDLCYGTYYFDTKAGQDAVESVASAGETAKVVASYGADGKSKRIMGVNRGLRINKLANGKVKKVVK